MKRIESGGNTMRRRKTPAAFISLLIAIAMLVTLWTPYLAYKSYAADDDWGLWLGGVNVRTTPHGTNYDYDETNHILTLKNYTTEKTSAGNDKTAEKISSNQSSGIYQYYKAFLYNTRNYKGTGDENKTGNLVIVLEGNNRLGQSDRTKYGYKSNGSDVNESRQAGIISYNEGVTIRGSGTLTVNCQTHSFISSNYTQESGTVTFNSPMEGMDVAGNVLVNGGRLNVSSFAGNLPFYAVKVRNNGSKVNGMETGLVYVAQGAEMTAETAGNYYSDFIGDERYAVAVWAANKVAVYGRLSATGQGKGSNSGENGGNQSFAIKTGKLIIDDGGRVLAYSNGKDNKDHSDGSTTVQVDDIQVGFSGYFRAYNNAGKGGLKAGKLGFVQDGADNSTAAITLPRGAQHDGNGYVTSYTDRTQNRYPLMVEISGLGYTSLGLGKTDNISDTSWLFYNVSGTGYVASDYFYNSSSLSGGSAYGSDGLNLSGGAAGYTGNMGTYFNQLKPLDYQRLREIVAVNGSQTLKLNGIRLTDRDKDKPFITVKKDATLTLKLKGMNYLENKNNQPVIYVENGGTLNIEAEDGGTGGSLSLVSKGDSAIECEGETAYVNIKSGVVYTRGYGTSSTSRIGSGPYNGNITISGGYVASDLGGKLTVTGGTIPAGFKSYGKEVTVTGGSVGCGFSENVQVKGINGQPVYKTSVQLYNVMQLQNNSTAKWTNVMYQTKPEDGGFGMNTLRLPAVQRIDLEKEGSKVSGYGVGGLYGTADKGSGTPDMMYLYLPEGTKTVEAMIQPNLTSTGTEAQPLKANLGEDITTTPDGKASGRLYLRTMVLGEHVMALRQHPGRSDSMQMCPVYNNNSSDIWYDYDESTEMMVGNVGNNDEFRVQNFGIDVLDGTHSITMKRLKIFGKNQRLSVGSGRNGGTLNVLLNGKSELTADGEDNVINLNFTGNLNLTGSYKNNQQQTVSTGGWLTLKGDGAAFSPWTSTKLGITLGHGGGDPASEFSVTDAVLANECTGKAYDSYTMAFKKLTFTNATVMNLGNIQCSDITIDGGSVDIDAGNATVKNSNGNPLTKTKFQVAGISDYTKLDALDITGLPEGAVFGTDCIWTDKEGNITLWLPEGAKVESAAIGGMTYHPSGGKLVPRQKPVFADSEVGQTVEKANGETFELSPECTASPEPTYQWQSSTDGQNWTDIHGATDAAYSGTMNTSLHGMQYRCVAENTVGTGYSNVFTLACRPVITAQPSSTTVKAKDPAAFTISVEQTEGMTVSYQWQSRDGNQDWRDIEGATGSSYTVSSVTDDNDGFQYRCVVTSARNGVSASSTSDAAKLNVVGAPEISAHPKDVTVKEDQHASFSVEAGVKPGETVLAYQWQQSTDGINWSDIDGADKAKYTFNDVKTDMDGRKFRCAVSAGLNGVSHTHHSEPAVLTVVGAPEIRTEPRAVWVTTGRSASFSVEAAGNQTLSYQWQVKKSDTASFEDIDGATESSYTIDAAQRSMAGWEYRCVVKNEANGVSQTAVSPEAPLYVNDPAGITPSKSLDEDRRLANENLDLVASEAKDAVRTLDELTDDDRASCVDEIERAVSTGKENIGKASDSNGVNAALESAKAAIQELVYAAEDKNNRIRQDEQEKDCPSEKYTDLDTALWYHEAIDFVLDSKYFNGVGNDRFEPDGPMTRAMFVTVLSRMDGVDTSQYRGSSFTDVSGDAWYAEAVKWASDNHIVDGVGDGRFDPDGDVTREQMAAIMHRYMDYRNISLSGGDASGFEAFTDSGSVSGWAKDAMVWAVGCGLINGMGNGTLAPQDGSTRAQVAQVIMNYAQVLGAK